mgnify:CR=1 FL=1
MSLSMSMMVDRRSTKSNVTIRPRTPATWIPDKRAKRCFGCNTLFSTFRRKHHCRSCGRIFCTACSAYREIIPSYLSNFENTLDPQRTCAPCAQMLQKTAKVEHLVRIVSLLPVCFSELFLLRLLNSKWNCATNTLFSLFRGLQYKLPCQPYSSVEIDFLWTHHKELFGHVQWQIHAMASQQQIGLLHKRIHHFVVQRTKLSCRLLLCSRTCHAVLSIEDIIRLGSTKCLEQKNIQKWVVEGWQRIQTPVHVKMMFWWVWLACRFPSLFVHGLIPLCTQELELTYALWFECELQKTTKLLNVLERVQIKLVKGLHESSRKKLYISKEFCETLKYTTTLECIDQQQFALNSFFGKYREVHLPWNPRVIIKSMSNLTHLKSSSRPILATCLTFDNKSFKILLKREDVRTDRLSMVIGYWIEQLTSGIHVHTYSVFPLNKSSGVIELIENATTLYDVKNQGFSLLNFILSNNSQSSIETLRGRIVSSCAGACLLAFTMGLGDRHLENIMVTGDARLVHVDFGFVLGDDPKLLRAPMRITDEMVDAMGGRNSTTFALFVQLVKNAYEEMRLHTSFWYHLLSTEWFIFEDSSRSWQRIRDHVLERFVPGEWNNEAGLQIESIVQKAANDSLFQQMADFAHFASNHAVRFQMDV